MSAGSGCGAVVKKKKKKFWIFDGWMTQENIIGTYKVSPVHVKDMN